MVDYQPLIDPSIFCVRCGWQLQFALERVLQCVNATNGERMMVEWGDYSETVFMSMLNLMRCNRLRQIRALQVFQTSIMSKVI